MSGVAEQRWCAEGSQPGLLEGHEPFIGSGSVAVPWLTWWNHCRCAGVQFCSSQTAWAAAGASGSWVQEANIQSTAAPMAAVLSAVIAMSFYGGWRAL